MISNESKQKQVLTFSWRFFKNLFILFRSLLWSGLFFLALYGFSYLRQDNLDLLGLLLVLVSIPVSIVLIVKQFISDLTWLKNKYTQRVFEEVYKDLNNDNSSSWLPIYNMNIGALSKEFLWDISTSDVFDDINSYVRMYPYRRDHMAYRMRNSFLKDSMRSLILSSPNYVHSIRIYEATGTISFDYKYPIPFEEIVGFYFSENTNIIRGKGVTTTKTNHKGYSYPTLFGRRSYRGKSTTKTLTTYEPDRIVKEYTLNVCLNPLKYDGDIQMKLGCNHQLAHEIDRYFIRIGIPNKNYFMASSRHPYAGLTQRYNSNEMTID